MFSVLPNSIIILSDIFVVILTSFRLAVLRKWRSKYGPNATYRNLANCFYSADKLDMVEAISQALGAPNSSLMGQEEEGMSSIFAAAH